MILYYKEIDVNYRPLIQLKNEHTAILNQKWTYKKLLNSYRKNPSNMFHLILHYCVTIKDESSFVLHELEPSFQKSSYERYELCIIYILWQLVNDIILLNIISLPYFNHLSLDRQNKALLPHLSFWKEVKSSSSSNEL